MKWQDVMEIDAGDLYLAHQAQARERGAGLDRMTRTKGHWIIDRATGKKLAGPFKDDDAAVSFKQNRKDRIPADARIKFM
jgi:hypothetical protein